MKAICHREGLLQAVQLASAALPALDVAKPILKRICTMPQHFPCMVGAMALPRPLLPRPRPLAYLNLVASSSSHPLLY